jgi:predicted DsbA family dithiol-disulfide isomerase
LSHGASYDAKNQMDPEMNQVIVDVTSDFICPWCWIGHRNLKAGITSAGLDAAAVQVRFTPFELNPWIPKEGRNRKEYRSRKFGSWERSQSMDAVVAAAGRRVGAEFNYDRVEVTPNTRLAHRLMYWSRSRGDAVKLEALPEAIFAAYFSEGKNIGSAPVLVEIASSVGFDGRAVRAYLSSSAGEREVATEELQAQMDGLHSVPLIRIAGQQISGAQPPAVIARVLRGAAVEEPRVSCGVQHRNAEAKT